VNAAENEHPYTEPIGHAEIDGRWVLTHVIWHPTLPWGGHGNQPETGVRDRQDVDTATGRERFDLIQHGWRDFKRAEAVIVKGLRKGWSPFRISEAMERAKNWGRKRATVL